MIRSASAFAAAWLVTAALLSPALAQEPQPAQGQEIIVSGKRLEPGMEQRVVSIGDLNLATEQGVKEMEKRVASAVDSICAVPSVVGYYSQQVERPCREEGWASARPQMDRAVENARTSSNSE